MDRTFTLHYFPICGRAEAARLIMEYAGAKYEYKMPNWPAYKSELLFEQLPELIDGDFHLVQSKAIARYLGREFNLYGSNNKEAATVDMLLDGEEELRTRYTQHIYSSMGLNFERDIEKFKTEFAPKYLRIFEKVLEKTNTGLLVSDKVTIADIMLFDTMDNLVHLDGAILDNYPKLSAFKKRIAEIPQIAAYLSSDRRPKQINGNGKGQ